MADAAGATASAADDTDSGCRRAAAPLRRSADAGE